MPNLPPISEGRGARGDDAALGEINRLVHNRTEELSAHLSDLLQSYQELSQELGG